jgi:tetratricopeptide (TPR) repeat protein
MTFFFIDRPETDKFLSKLAEGLKDPVNNPLVLHSWGIGGVGKTTLLARIIEQHPEVAVAKVSFGETSDIETQIELMKHLHDQLYPHKSNDGWENDEDEFIRCYNKREITISKLSQDRDAKEFSKILQGGIQVAASINKPVADVGGSVIKAASASTGLIDRFNNFLNRMIVTRGNVELQKLISEPISILTKAFASSLRAKAAQKGVLVIFDTYEKVAKDTDYWLYNWLLANNELHNLPVRLVVTGRNDILRQEEWRKLQQNRGFIYSQGVEKFDENQTKAYLSKIGINKPDDLERFYSITKGLPYYLNLIREKLYDGKNIDLNLTRLAQNIEDLFFQEVDPEKKRRMSRVSRVAACCQSFDRGLIERLITQLDLPTIIDDSDCYNWLKQQHFFDEGQNRLDDVARDVFRRLLFEEEQEKFTQVHSLLADYFRTKSDRYASPDSSYVDKYENEDWLTARSTYLYHRMFADRVDTAELIGYLLESRYFGANKLVQVPLQEIISEANLDDHPFLSAQGRKFLIDINPVIMDIWQFLEISPINYDYLKWQWNFSRADVTRIISACLKNNSQIGLSEFMRLCYKFKRCQEPDRYNYLIQAKLQVECKPILNESAEFIHDLLCNEIASPLFESGRYQEAIDVYNQALKNKSDSDTFYNKGTALGHLDRHEEAINSYDQSLAADPEKYEALNNKSIALKNLSRYEEALIICDKAIAINSDRSEAFVNKGLILVNLNRKEEAVDAYDKAIEKGTNLCNVFYNKGMLLGDLDQYKEAILCCDKYLDIQPEYANAHYNKSCYLILSGEIKLAINALQKAISLEPEKRESAKIDPDFDAIRNDARFQQLIAEPHTQP